jgi:hypothetical protein
LVFASRTQREGQKKGERDKADRRQEIDARYVLMVSQQAFEVRLYIYKCCRYFTTVSEFHRQGPIQFFTGQ